MKNLTILLLLLICSSFIVIAQKDTTYNYGKIFRGTSLINMQTTENAPEGGFNFVVQHRFGQADIKDGLLYNFLGMDLTSNMRLGFVIPINRLNYVGIGRTKFGKYYDFEWKRILLRQSTDNRKPFSIALYTNATVYSADLPTVEDDNYFGDGQTPFEYEALHRWSYSSQLIFSKKFGRKFSLLVSPTFVYKNLVPIGKYNKNFVMPIGASFKTGLFSSVIFEYTYTYLDDPPFGSENPISIGWEYQSASHVFQIFICNNNDILDHNYYLNDNNARILDGKFILGFNIHKTFWVKK